MPDVENAIVRVPLRGERFVRFSGNKKYFFFLTNVGELNSDTESATLHIYRTSDVANALSGAIGTRAASQPLPYRELTMQSQSSVHASINQPDWRAGEEEIVFVGVNQLGERQFFLFDIHNGKLSDATDRASTTGSAQPEGPKSTLRYPGQFVPRTPDGAAVHELVVQQRGFLFGTQYPLNPDSENMVSMPMELSSGVGAQAFQVGVLQGSNEPPMVIASAQGRRFILWKAQGMAVLAQATVPYEWHEGSSIARGGLTLPRGQALHLGKRLPLVIQVSRYLPKYYLPDGAERSSEAAQLLAARGFAVLQIDMPSDSRLNIAAPGKALLLRVQSAIGSLAERGLVDIERVALNCSSDATDAMYYLLTHADMMQVGAAVGTDFRAPMTFSNYLIQAGAGGVQSVRAVEAAMGGAFWENKQAWLENEPSLNADRVRTPLLISRHGRGVKAGGYNAREVLNLIGAFVLNDKPIEYLYLPQAGHQPLRPLERMALINASVDWLSFWVQQYEDPSPHKARQYARWRAMKARKHSVP